MIPIVIFIVCWYIWVFSTKKEAKKKAVEFSNKTQIVQHKLAEIWFRVWEKIFSIRGGVIFIGIIIVLIV